MIVFHQAFAEAVARILAGPGENIVALETFVQSPEFPDSPSSPLFELLHRNAVL